MFAPWKKSYDQPRQHSKKKRHYFASKGPSSQGYGFSSSHVWMWELDYKESWYFWTVALEKTLESPLDCKEIQPVHPKGNQSWIFTGRTDAEAEALVLWPPDVKSRLIGKDPDGGKDGRQKEKRVTEDEMVGWHHRLSGREFEHTPGDGEGQGSLVSCSSWGGKEPDTTQWLNNEQQQFKEIHAISVHFSILHSSQDMERSYVSIENEWIRTCDIDRQTAAAV